MVNHTWHLFSVHLTNGKLSGAVWCKSVLFSNGRSGSGWDSQASALIPVAPNYGPKAVPGSQHWGSHLFSSGQGESITDSEEWPIWARQRPPVEFWPWPRTAPIKKSLGSPRAVSHRESGCEARGSHASFKAGDVPAPLLLPSPGARRPASTWGRPGCPAHPSLQM